jgi:hypothetical protein
MLGKKLRNLVKGKMHSRRKRLVIVALIISLITAGGTLARWSEHFSMTQKKQAKELAPAALNPTAPLKEYVYVGGKLTAIEEQ